jgi:hypothetical protein
MGSIIHVIRIPLRDDQIRAFKAFLPIPASWVRLPGNVYGVSDAHLKALEQVTPKINFDYVSKSPQNGQSQPVSS